LRLEEEQDRLSNKKVEILRAKENFESDGNMLQKLNCEFTDVMAFLSAARQKNSAANTKYEELVDDYTKMERKTELNQKTSEEHVQLMKGIDDIMAKCLGNISPHQRKELFKNQLSKFSLDEIQSISQPLSVKNAAYNYIDPFSGSDLSSGFSPVYSRTAEKFDDRMGDDPFSSKRTNLALSPSSNADFANFDKFSAAFGDH